MKPKTVSITKENQNKKNIKYKQFEGHFPMAVSRKKIKHKRVSINIPSKRPTTDPIRRKIKLLTSYWRCPAL